MALSYLVLVCMFMFLMGQGNAQKSTKKGECGDQFFVCRRKYPNSYACRDQYIACVSKAMGDDAAFNNVILIAKCEMKVAESQCRASTDGEKKCAKILSDCIGDRV